MITNLPVWIILQNESLLYDEKPKRDKEKTTAASVESEEDSGVELSNTNEAEQQPEIAYTNIDEDNCINKAADRSGKENTKEKSDSSHIEAKVKVTRFKIDTDKDSVKSNKSDTGENEERYPDKSAIDSDTGIQKLSMLKEEIGERESESSQTDSSCGDFGYYRGDSERDFCTTDSSQSESTFKRSRSFGDRPIRRRTVF